MLHTRIFLFEEIGGRYDDIVCGGDRVSRFVRSIQRIHHADEARRITFDRAAGADPKDREIPFTPDLIHKAATLARVRDNFLVAA